MTATQTEFEKGALSTPAFVYDEETVMRTAATARTAATINGCKLLYSLKPFVFADGLRLLANEVDGFAASSVFEARLARSVIRDRGTLHLTSPGLREADLIELESLCDYISFNSLSQWNRLQPLVGGDIACGLRVNPGLSFVSDSRYDPCRANSKLGVSVRELVDWLDNSSEVRTQVTGLHFHSNCDSSDYSQLGKTVALLRRKIGPALFSSIQWINVGGGYLFSGEGDLAPFKRAIDTLRGDDKFEVFLEPGAGLVREAGYLVSTVVDIFESGSDIIAILDTSINHMPEVFEYQFEPDLLTESAEGDFEYALAGSSCLAGDLFGRYCFDQPLSVGSVVVFSNVGAYSLVKAHMFNGINLPTIYARTSLGTFERKREYTFEDFADRAGLVHR